MRKSNKMNGLFKAGFIILLVCIPMFLMSLAVAYIFEEIYLSAVFSAGGAFLAFLGIIFVMYSKPKKIKPKKAKRKRLKKHMQKSFEADENSDFVVPDKEITGEKRNFENIDNKL